MDDEDDYLDLEGNYATLNGIQNYLKTAFYDPETIQLFLNDKHILIDNKDPIDHYFEPEDSEDRFTEDTVDRLANDVSRKYADGMTWKERFNWFMDNQPKDIVKWREKRIKKWLQLVRKVRKEIVSQVRALVFEGAKKHNYMAGPTRRLRKIFRQKVPRHHPLTDCRQICYLCRVAAIESIKE